jgi:type IV secretory pathway VirB10-like protein
MRHRPNKPKLYRWIVTSIVAHLGVVGAYFLLTWGRDRFQVDEQIIAVHIVQMGKKPDPDMLPRLVPDEPKVETQTKSEEPQPPPAVQPKPEPIPEPQKHAIKPPKPAEKKKPAAGEVNPLQALDRILKKSEKLGDPDGAKHGNSTFGFLKDNYASGVQALLEDAWRIPVTLKIMSRSRNPDYDDAVTTTVKKIEFFGKPPAQFQSEIQRQGLRIVFCAVKPCPI